MTIEYLATLDIDSLTQPYEGRLISPPMVRKRLGDRPGGFVEIQNVSATIANADGKLTDAYLRDLRSRSWVIKHYDAFSGTTTTDFIGQVERDSLGEGVLELDGTNVDLAIFDKEIPSKVIDTERFPKAVDTGKVIPVVFGNVPKVTLPYVEEDLANSLFTYAVGEGDITVGQVWRSGGLANPVKVTGGEYTRIVTSGKTYLRFALRQTNTSGALHTIYADIVGFQPERNAVNAIKKILTDTEWGLGQTVDANWDWQRHVLDTDLDFPVCDGAIVKQQKAQDILQQFLMIRGMRLGMNASRQWTITVDRPPTSLKMAISSGPGDAARNLARVSRRTRVAAADRPHIYTFKYRLDMVEGNEYRAEQTRTFGTAGTEIVEQNDFVRVATTADKIADYRAKLLYYGQETIEDAELTQEARSLDLNDVVAFSDPALACLEDIFQVREIEVGYDSVRAKFAAYHLAIHQYTPGTILVEETDPTGLDLSHTAPGPVTGLTKTGEGMEQGNDGGTEAWILLRFDTPTTNCVGARVDFKRNLTEVEWHKGVALTHDIGSSVQVKVRGLVPNIPYDYQVVALNSFGLASTATILTNQFAFKDTIVPALPTGVTATPAANKTVHIAFVPSADADIKGYDWQIEYSGGSWNGSVAVTPWQPTITISLEAFQYNVTYSVVIWPFDFSGNYSLAATAPVTFIFATPGAVDGLAVVGTGAEQGDDGGTTAFIVIHYNVPGTNCAGSRVDYRRASEGGSWHEGLSVTTKPLTGVYTQVRLRGLLPNIAYDYRVVALSPLGIESTPAYLMNQQAVRDGVAPGPPASVYVNIERNRSLIVALQPPADRDFKLFEFWVTSGSALPTGSMVTYGSVPPATGTQGWHNISFDGFTTDVQYWIHFRSVDYSGNVSAWTAGTPFMFATPPPPLAAQFSSEGVELGVDGRASAWIDIYVQSPNIHSPSIRVDFRRNGVEDSYQSGAANMATTPGGAARIRVRGLVPGVTYDYRVTTVSAINLESSGIVFSRTAPGDATIPPTPTNLSVVQHHRTVMFQCLLGDSGQDTKSIEWFMTSDAGGTAGIDSGAIGVNRDNLHWIKGSITYGAASLAYGVTYYLRVRAVDYSGNRSAYTGTVGFTYTTQNTADITAGAVSDLTGAAAYAGNLTGTGFGGAPIVLATANISCAAGDMLLGFGGITVVGAPVSSLVRVYLRNTTNAHESAPVESTVAAGEQISPVVIALDFATVAGNNPIELRMLMGAAGQAFFVNYGYIQVTKLKR